MRYSYVDKCLAEYVCMYTNMYLHTHTYKHLSCMHMHMDICIYTFMSVHHFKLQTNYSQCQTTIPPKFRKAVLLPTRNGMLTNVWTCKCCFPIQSFAISIACNVMLPVNCQSNCICLHIGCKSAKPQRCVHIFLIFPIAQIPWSAL